MSALKAETGPEDKPIAANSNTDDPGNNRRPRKQRTFRDKWRAVSINNKLIVVFSGLTMLATAVYSVFAGWQLLEIHKGASDTHTLAVATKTQSDIAKQVTEANFEAVCDVRTETNIPADRQTTNIVNTGGVNAVHVNAHLEVTRNSLPDLGVLAVMEKIDVDEPEILKNKGLPVERATALHLTEDQKKRMLDDKETVDVQGTLDYDNGFGTVKRKQVCRACIADPFQAERQQPPLPESQWTCTWETECAGVQTQLQNVAAERQRRNQQQSKKPN